MIDANRGGCGLRDQRMRSLASLRSNYSGCENVYVLAAVERKIHGCETKSERYRDEAKDYNHRNIIVTLYKGSTLKD